MVRLGVWLFCFTVFSGCFVHPEKNSGPDGYRDQAAIATPGEWIPDTIGGPGDTTDWRRIDFGASDSIRVRVVVQRKLANVQVGLYEARGILRKQAGRPFIAYDGYRMDVYDDVQEGTYYVRIRSLDRRPTPYSIQIVSGPEARNQIHRDSNSPPPK